MMVEDLSYRGRDVVEVARSYLKLYHGATVGTIVLTENIPVVMASKALELLAQEEGSGVIVRSFAVGGIDTKVYLLPLEGADVAEFDEMVDVLGLL